MSSHCESDTSRYPVCVAIVRSISVGATTKHDLLTQLQAANIQLNESAHALFAHENFVTSPAISQMQTIELSVADLGHRTGATITQIFDQATASGLSLCPLELAPHLRLQYLDQPEGHIGFPPSQHQAPPGSLTIASQPLTTDFDTPKGFYLRRIEGTLWLRGYRSSPDHVWNPADRFIFRRPPATP